MVKCPFCHFDNEDGALFCEQCKSDLAGVEVAAAAPPVAAVAEPVAALAEPVAAAEVVEAIPLAGAEAVPVAAEVVASPVLEAPPTAPVAEAMPLEEPLADEVAPPTAAAAPAPVAAAPPPVAAPAAEGEAPPLPPGAQPRLLVLRGQKRNVEFPVYEGHNFIGRADEKPVDIDLEDQEPPDRIWSSRQHALITFENSCLVIEDLNSSNGTFVNRARIYPGQKRGLAVNDIIQIGTVQLKVIV